MKKYFVTGTDTDVGKTAVAAAILYAAEKSGLSTIAMKPISAGCVQTEQGLRNEDALLLQEMMTADLPYDQVNPVAFEPAIAPHIAAAQAGKRLLISQLVGYCRGLLMQKADLAIIEGAGGWRLPLNHAETLAGFAKELQLPVIMVVGMKLGCLNHALLTAEAIARDGLPLVGWVANQIDPNMSEYSENVDSLKSLLRAPYLGEVPYLENPTPQAISSYLSLDQLLSLS